jgi:mono/diheme cytochrome c family protein
MLKAAGVLFAFTALAAPAFAADVAHGERIARRWCATCHVVAPDQTKGSTEAPSFADISRRVDDDRRLAGFLADPHPRMPDMNLSRPEITDIVAYIRKLGPPRPPAPREKDDPKLPKNG